MTRATTEVEVAVIGAGPAGAVFATRMAQLGFDVCLVERARFPRSHLGESLTPGVMPMLASMGSASAVAAAGFRRVAAVNTNWDGPETVRHDPRAEGLLVDRGAFDSALVSRADAVGVRVLHPAHVRAHARAKDGWHLQVDTMDASLDLRARFLADATGRTASFGERRRPMGPRTIAIYGYWVGAPLPGQPRIEAGEHEWYWGVPIPDGSYNTLVFVDGERFRAEPGGSLADRLRALLERSALMRDVQGAHLHTPPRAADATPYLDEDVVSASHIRIGDAALALDPLSSSGVQKAIQTALSGAIVANTLLRRAESGALARRFYRDSVNEASARHRAWASGHYATVARRFSTPFWTDRAAHANPESLEPAPVPAIADDAPVQVSPAAQWEELPCLGAQYVEVKLALRHPRLDGPVAYVGGQELAPLLRRVRPGMTWQDVARAWSQSVPIGNALSIARWLSSHGVLERCPQGHP